jgi:hypothetical protein
MMGARDDQRQNGSPFSLAEAPAIDRSATVYSGGNWQKAGPEGTVGGHRRLLARKFDGSKYRNAIGRPPVPREIADLIVRMARENPGWGYDRIVGALSNLGHTVCDKTVGNVLRRHAIAPAPKRSQTTTWKDFIAAHMAVLTGIDFFTVEVLTWRGLATY